MAVTNTDLQAGPYFPNGAATSFAFAFRVLTKPELAVYRGEPGVWAAVDPALYDVVLGATEGGSVVFPDAPSASAGSLYIVGDPEFRQDAAFRSGEAPFNPKAINAELERGALRSIKLRGSIDGVSARALMAPDGDVLGSIQGARPGKVIGFGADPFTPLMLNQGGADSALREDLADPEVAPLLVAAKADDVAAAPLNQGQKNNQQMTLEDFRHAEDANDYPAFRRMVDYINKPTARWSVIIPAGDYELDAASLIASPLIITRPENAVGGGVSIIGQEARIRVTGAGMAAFVLQCLNTSATIVGCRFYGNSQANTSFANGFAIQQLLTAAATASVRGISVRGCSFENFAGPYWLYVFNQSASHRISGGEIVGNGFRSRVGNSVLPDNVGMPADAICLYGEAGSAGVDGFQITGNIVFAEHMKGGIRLFHCVNRAAVNDNRVFDAGQSGATDDAAAYAYSAYADSGEMNNISFTNNFAFAVRSVAFYMRGAITGLVIDGAQVTTTLDASFATLPKGGVVLLGVIDFDVSNVTAIDCAGYAVFYQPNGDLPSQRSSIRGVRAYSCFAAVWVAAFGNDIPDLQISDVGGNECQWGVVVALYDGFEVSGSISKVRVKSGIANSDGVVVVAIQSDRLIGSLTLEDVRVQTVRLGVDVQTMPNITLRDIKTRGNFATNGVRVDGCTGLCVDGVELRNMSSGGKAWSAAGAQGTLTGVSAIDVADAHLLNISGTDLGLNLPTWPASATASVQNLLPSGSGFERWVRADGSWKQAGVVAA